MMGTASIGAQALGKGALWEGGSEEVGTGGQALRESGTQGRSGAGRDVGTSTEVY